VRLRYGTGRLVELGPDDPPDRSMLPRWLKRATQQGLIRRSASGYCGDSFRYWLPGHEPLLRPGDNASEEERQAWRERRAAHLRGLGNGWGCK
jgi:hypothetical protein